MRRSFTWLPWVLLIIVIISFAVWQKMHTPKAPISSDGVKLPAEKVEPLVNTSRSGGVVSYSAAVKVAAPAVVNIFTTQKVKQMNHPVLNDPVFREFFGDQLPEQFKQGPNENSLGSGVIVRPDGYILTNNHVIEQADQIVVALQDGRRAVARVIGTDPESDLAVIKIELDKLPVLPFKLSGNEVGDVVLAIGNPFGVGQTVTQGIISATGRSDLGINTYEDFMKVDLRVAEVLDAAHVEGSDKLLQLTLNVGEAEPRNVFSGIREFYAPEDLKGKLVVMVANLAPRKMRFGISNGMVLAAGNGEGVWVISPESGAKAGDKVS